MLERSAYEGHLDRTGTMCVGVVQSVSTSDAAGRRLRVKTIGGPGGDDLDLHHVRIMGNWHPDGDESTHIPRAGTYGLVTFIKTEAFWLGAFPLDANSGENQRTNMEKLNPGDIVWKTVRGNKIILRTGGTVEISSSDLCSLLMTPNNNLIGFACQNFELETSAGVMKWRLDPETEDTRTHISCWNNLNPDTLCTIDVGLIPDTNNEDSALSAALGGTGSVSIEAPQAADLMFDFKIGAIDEDLNITDRVFRTAIKNDGSLYLDIGPGKFTLSVDPATGDAQFQSQGDVTGYAKGALDVTVDGDTSVTSTGDVTVNTKGGLAVEAFSDIDIKNKVGGMKIGADGKVAFGSSAAELLDLIDQLIKAIQQINVGTGVGPSSTPLNAAAFMQIGVKLALIKGSL